MGLEALYKCYMPLPLPLHGIRPELDMDWIRPWIRLDWVGLDRVRIFRELCRLVWDGWDDRDPLLIVSNCFFLTNYDF